MKIVKKQTVDEKAKHQESKKLQEHWLLEATPEQIEAYIDAEVTDIKSAKQVLKLLAKLVILRPKL